MSKMWMRVVSVRSFDYPIISRKHDDPRLTDWTTYGFKILVDQPTIKVIEHPDGEIRIYVKVDEDIGNE